MCPFPAMYFCQGGKASVGNLGEAPHSIPTPTSPSISFQHLHASTSPSLPPSLPATPPPPPQPGGRQGEREGGGGIAEASPSPPSSAWSSCEEGSPVEASDPHPHPHLPSLPPNNSADEVWLVLSLCLCPCSSPHRTAPVSSSLPTKVSLQLFAIL
jgi:hypothetical protein